MKSAITLYLLAIFPILFVTLLAQSRQNECLQKDARCWSLPSDPNQLKTCCRGLYCHRADTSPNTRGYCQPKVAPTLPRKIPNVSHGANATGSTGIGSPGGGTGTGSNAMGGTGQSHEIGGNGQGGHATGGTGIGGKGKPCGGNGGNAIGGSAVGGTGIGGPGGGTGQGGDAVGGDAIAGESGDDCSTA